MLKTLAPLAVALSLAGPAGAATIITVDFEDAPLGNYTSPPLPGAAGIGSGQVVEFGGGKSLKLTSYAGPEGPQSGLWFGAVEGEFIEPGEGRKVYAPLLQSVDVHLPNGGYIVWWGPSPGRVDLSPGQTATLPLADAFDPYWGCRVGCSLFIHADEAVVDNIAYQAVVASIPEPTTWAMMIAGFGLVGLAARRRSGTRPSAQPLGSSASPR